MMGPARRRWQSLQFDDQVLLAFAFRDATTNPIRVADYILQFHEHSASGEVVSIHQFRIGFANFILIETSTTLFIFDLWLDDDMALAAE
jgi:hypothetical protein